MDRDPPPPKSRSIPSAAGTTTTSPMIRGATSSRMLTLSSSSYTTQFHRQYYPSSLYPPPLPTRLASGSTSTGCGYGSASSRFQLPPPLPPRTAVDRPGRPITTPHSLPTPFLEELAKIRTVGSTLFGDLDALAPSPATRRGAAIHGSVQHREPWTPLLPSTTTMSAAGGKSYSGLPPPLPSAAGIGMAPPLPTHRFSAYSSPSASQPLSSGAHAPSWASTGMPSLTNPRFSGTGGILSEHPPSWASQQHQQAAQPWSTADLAALSSLSAGSGIFTTGSTTPAASQLTAKTSSSFTDLAPLPGGCGLSGITNETTMFGSSSWSPAGDDMARAATDTTMYYGQVQPSYSDSSELPPLPPSVQMHMEDQNLAPSFWQEASENNNSYGGNETAASAYTASASEEPKLQASTTTTTHHRLQVVKEEPVFDDIVAPCREPVFIALDDDDEKILSALLESLESSTDKPAANLTNQAPLSSDGWLGNVEGSGQSWDLEALLHKPASGGASGNIPSMNYDIGSMSMSQQQQQQILPQQGDQFSTGLFSDNISQHWQLSQNNTSSGFVQTQPNQQIPLLPYSTDSLQLNNSSSHIPSIWNTGGADSSGHGWTGLPALANMLHTMNIGQGGTAVTTAPVDQYAGMFDFGSSGSSTGALAAMPSFATNFDQMMNTGGGMSIGHGFSATPPAPMFDSSSSSSAWASMPLNFSSSSTTRESSIPSVPNLRLGGMEKPKMPRWTPSLPAGASSSGMSRRGTYGDFFSVADMAMINNDKRLKEMVSTDPKRVKRILNNRASAAKLKVQRLDLS
ncbi:unnamed protein product [Urochloa humidicola]